MSTQREPVIQFAPEGPSVPLNTSGPLSETELAGKTHLSEKRILRYSLAGKAQGTYVLWNIPAGIRIKEVEATILTACTASATLAIQDAAIWIAAGELAEQTVGSTAKGVVSSGGALQNGKYYSAGDTLDLVIGGADCVVGEILVEVTFTDTRRFTAQLLGAAV